MTTSVRIEQPTIVELDDLFGEGDATVSVVLDGDTVLADSLDGLVVFAQDLLERCRSAQDARARRGMGPLPGLAGTLPIRADQLRVGQRFRRDGDSQLYDVLDVVNYVSCEVVIRYSCDHKLELDVAEIVRVEVPECEGSSIPYVAPPVEDMVE